MITVITATRGDSNALLDRKFGRSKWFCIFNSETRKHYYIANEYLEETEGVGTKVAEMMAELNADQVIAGDFGPNARALLEKLDIQMVAFPEEKKVRHIIQTLRKK